MGTAKDDSPATEPISNASRREGERHAARERRLAEALRQNLKRRKEQARGRSTPVVGEPGSDRSLDERGTDRLTEPDDIPC